MRDCNRLVTLTPITEYLWFMMKKREEYKLDSPVGGGFSVLGLSKWIVARHWTQLKEKYGDDVRVIQTAFISSCMIIICMLILKKIWRRRENWLAPRCRGLCLRLANQFLASQEKAWSTGFQTFSTCPPCQIVLLVQINHTGNVLDIWS